jgi:16S rRNA (adenine1518-N6/adenine1519-N6)-dimethyltransferase
MPSQSSVFKFRPKKRFSQNFLVNLHAAERIVDSVNLTREDTVLEIGAGKGVLTQFLIQRAKKVLAVELDRNLIVTLREKFAQADNLETILSDILKLKVADYLLPQQKIKIVGNLPYQITSPILEWIVNQREFIQLAVVTVQKEVAKRICARPGTKEWSPLSIFCQVYTKPKLLFSLSAGSFFPAPKVQSGVVSLEILKQPLVPSVEQEVFFELVHRIFTARRKTLLRTLVDKTGLTKLKLEEIFSVMHLDSKIRGETLSLRQLWELAAKLTIDSF